MNSVRYIISALVILFSLTLTAQESNQLLSRDFWGQKPSLAQVKASVAAGNDPSEANGSNFDPVVMAIFGDASEEVIDYLFAQEGNSVNKLTHDGRTYIFWAASRGNFPLEKSLLMPVLKWTL